MYLASPFVILFFFFDDTASALRDAEARYRLNNDSLV
jgi:hypothetical protein